MHGNKQFLNSCKTGQHIILNPISIRQISVKYLPISDKRERKAVHQLLTSSSIAIKVALHFILSLSFSLKYIFFISLSLKYDIFISLSQKYVLFISIFFSLNMLSLSMKYILKLKIVRKVAIYLYH